jgi:hypothetical protein
MCGEGSDNISLREDANDPAVRARDHDRADFPLGKELGCRAKIGRRLDCNNCPTFN